MKFLLILMAQLFIIACNTGISRAGVVQPGSIAIELPCTISANGTAAMLHERYNEELVYKGMSGFGLMKFYASEAKTFTITFEQGSLTCFVAGQYLLKESDGREL